MVSDKLPETYIIIIRQHFQNISTLIHTNMYTGMYHNYAEISVNTCAQTHIHFVHKIENEIYGVDEIPGVEIGQKLIGGH